MNSLLRLSQFALPPASLVLTIMFHAFTHADTNINSQTCEIVAQQSDRSPQYIERNAVNAVECLQQTMKVVEETCARKAGSVRISQATLSNARGTSIQMVMSGEVFSCN